MKKEMTISEFLNKDTELDQIAGYILNNKKLKNLTVFTLANLLYAEKVFASTKGLNKIDKAGLSLLEIVQKFGYWCCLIMGLIEILRSLMNGDTKSIGKIIAKYVLAFGSLFFLPYIFDIIKDVFK